MRPLAFALAAALLLVGCAEERLEGTIANARAPLAWVGASVGAPVEVAAPRDLRPAIEHEGSTDRTSLFFTIAVVTHWQRRGNYVTNDFAATPDMSNELRGVMVRTLLASRATSVPPPGARPPFELETDVEHLYATHYAANHGTVVVVPGKRAVGGGASTTSRQYASYGNVVLHTRLVDRRSGAGVVVWDELISGSGEAPPNDAGSARADRVALERAVGDAAAKLAVRLAAALDRLGVGPNRPGPAPPGDLPAAFVVERVSRLRDFIEFVVIESATGRVVSHVIKPLANRSYARPGDWLLSRRTADGATMSPDQYDATSHALAGRYDIRSYDDANRYHFFGLRGVVP